MSIGPYQEPEWAVRPSSSSIAWTLTEIKAGVEVAKHDLSQRATTVLGRAVDQVHVALHHQSISRQHARVAFDSNGTPWLRDLQSAHGTFVNKRRLPAKAIGKQESNSTHAGARGIVLNVGDVIKLGASSRYFSLEGPPPEATPEEQHLAKLNSSVSGGSAKAPGPTNLAGDASNPPKDEGISWGIDMGGDDGGTSKGCDSSTGRGSIELDPAKIPEIYRKELDKITAMKYKLANLETEDGRIRRKGGSDLSEGQQKQLDRNAEKEALLRKSIQEREERLHDKLHPNSGDSSSKRRRAIDKETSYDDEDDDFFDRTKNNSGAAGSFGVEEAESEETLTLKWERFVGERNHLTRTGLQKANDRVETLTSELKAMRESGNEEAFFVQNDLQLAVETKKKIEESLTKIDTTLDEIEKLLKVVNSKLNCDRDIEYIGLGQPPPQQASTNGNTDNSRSNTTEFPMPAARKTLKTAHLPMGPPATIQKEKPENTSMPPPPSLSTDSPSMPPPPFIRSGAQNDSPTNKRKRIIGPAAVPPNKASAEDSSQPPSKAPRNGTLSFLNHSSTSKTTEDKVIKSAENKKAQSGPKPYLKASVDASKMDVWRAPDGQDGSGKTKLNEKFAGRY